MQQINSTITILLARFNGQVLVPFAAGVESVGIRVQTARNQLVKGKFPIQTVLNGSRRHIRIQDLAEYVDKLYDQSTAAENKPRRGRPTKASEMAQR